MSERSISVTLAYSPAAREVYELGLALPVGSSVMDALRASGWVLRFPELASNPPVVGVWNRKVDPGQLLQDGDRVEVYRALKVDPKVARRQRFAKQGAKKAGLFAKVRPGSKTGY